MITRLAFLRTLRRLWKLCIHLTGIRGVLTGKNIVRSLPVIITICLSLIMTGVSFHTIREWERQLFLSDFERHSSHLTGALQIELSNHLEVLYSIEGLYYSSTEVTRHEFHTFVKRYLTHHPGIQALEWIPRVPDNERTSFEAAAILDGYPEFQFMERQTQGQMIPATQRDEYFPVYYVEPCEGNEIALGFNLASNPTRLEGLNRARDTGEATATARIILVQETEQQNGILIYMPVYYGGSNPTTVEERRQNLRGFALGVFRIGDVISTFMNTGRYKDLEIELYDETAPVGEQLLYTARPNLEGSEYLLSDFRGGEEYSTEVQHIASFDLAGRQWSIRITPTPDYLATSYTWYSWAVLLFGFIFTSLVGYFLFVRTKHALDIERIADVLSIRNRELEEEVAIRRQTEDELRASERKYSQLVEEGNDGIILIQDTRLIFANSKMREMTGLSEEEYIGRPFVEFITPQYKEVVVERYKKRISGEKVPNRYEIEILTRDGRKIPVEVNAGIIDYEGKPADMAIIRDITERKQMERAFQESERLYSTVANSSPVGVYIVQDRKFQFVNPRFQKDTGYSEGELLGMDPLSIVHPEDRESVRRDTEEMLKGNHVSPCEFRTIMKDGKVRWSMETVTSILYQGKRAVLGNYMDITERKRTEEGIKIFSDAVAGAIDAMGISDMNGIITYANSAMEETYGYEKGELLGKAVMSLNANPESSRSIMSGIIRTGGWSGEIEAVKKNRETFPALLSLSTVRDDRGNLIAMLGASRDITEQKRIEKEQKDTAQKAYLSSRLAAVGQMAAGIAHEINNPLTSVIGFAELLMARNDIPDDIRNDVKVINDGAQRVSKIVRGLLTFARDDKKERDIVDVNEIIKTTIALQSYEMETSNIKVKTYLDYNLPKTMAAGGQLQQVFLNLIINAKQAMKQAHGRGELVVRTKRTDGFIRISFKDDGSGIARANIDRIFEPFFTTKQPGEGTGLGLSLCYGIIKEHSGQIYVKSSRGRGATFIVELPVVSWESQPELPEAVDEKLLKEVPRNKILVVDDEPAVRRFLEHMLIEEGHEVETVDNADDALERIKKENFNLILLDIKMPDVSGIELYRRMQKVDRSLTRRVIFITGDVMATDTRAFLLKSGAAYISKPFEIKQLNKEIGRLLTEGG